MLAYFSVVSDGRTLRGVGHIPDGDNHELRGAGQIPDNHVSQYFAKTRREQSCESAI